MPTAPKINPKSKLANSIPVFGKNLPFGQKISPVKMAVQVNLDEQGKLFRANLSQLEDQEMLSQQIFAREEQLVNNLPGCSLGPFFLDQINPEKVNSLLEKRFYDAELMKAISCVAQVIAVAPKSQSLAAINRIHRWFRGLRLFGQAGNVSGFAMGAHLDNSSGELFVIKVPQDPEDKTTLNELFVGLFGTNKLRQVIPNFAYIYTGFRCSPPLINPVNSEISSWCDRGKKSYYLVYENIQPNLSVKSQCESLSPGNFLPLFLQLILALRTAEKVCGFTHWDLHYENVLFRVLPETVSIPYDTKYGKMYVNSNMIATIIDYGRSFIQVKTDKGLESFTDLTKPGVLAKTFILGDIHRFLCNCLILSRSNQPLYLALSAVLKFFTQMNVEPYLKLFNKYYYQLLPTPELEKVNIDDLVDHVLKISPIPLLYNTPTMQKVYSCADQSSTTCFLSKEKAIAEMVEVQPPSDLFEYIDRIRQYTETDPKQVVLGTANKAELYQKSLASYNALAEQIEKDLRNLVVITLQNSKNKDILNWAKMENYVNYVSKVMSIEEQLEQLAFEYEVLNNFATRNQLPEPGDKVLQLRKLFAPYTDYLRSDIAIAKRLITTSDYILAVKQDSRFRWLENSLIKLVDVLINV